MTDEPKPPDDICGGPRDYNDSGGEMVCRWCGDRDKEPGDRCRQLWPDRPRRTVHPRYRQITEMRVDCWQCGAPTVFDSVRAPQVFAGLRQPNGVLHGKCNACGAGIDVVEAKILRAGPPIAPARGIIAK